MAKVVIAIIMVGIGVSAAIMMATIYFSAADQVYFFVPLHQQAMIVA